MQSNITCLDCEHDYEDHHQVEGDVGCLVADCPCRETQINLTPETED